MIHRHIKDTRKLSFQIVEKTLPQILQSNAFPHFWDFLHYNDFQ